MPNKGTELLQAHIQVFDTFFPSLLVSYWLALYSETSMCFVDVDPLLIDIAF